MDNRYRNITKVFIVSDMLSGFNALNHFSKYIQKKLQNMVVSRVTRVY